MKLYHVSKDPNLTILIPRVPKNGLVEQGGEDGIHKRVCFAPSIQQSLRAMDIPVNRKTLYVYTPVGLNNRWIYKPKASQVPDVGLTGEIWYLRPCRVKLVEVIIGGKRYGLDFVHYKMSKSAKSKIAKEHPDWDISDPVMPLYSNVKYKSLRRTGYNEPEYDAHAGRISLLMSRIMNRKL